ncbi:MAG TPA: hypothetical protein VME22_03205 [Solirubrobacteraceae bacterium]|nr:hypothetical protein [Solirubrobacteraceae bacterium]
MEINSVGCDDVGFFDSFRAWTDDTNEQLEFSRLHAFRSEWRAPDEGRADRAAPFDALTAEFIADPDGADEAFQYVDAIADSDP